MLPVIILNAMHRYPGQFGRFSSVIRRSLATDSSSTSKSPTSKSSSDPPLITGMPKIIIPPEYQGLYDVKQEPGFVIINGKRYPYPYPGIHKEYNYPQLLDKWRKEGKVDLHNQPLFSKMEGRERILALQLWFQRDPSKPIHKLGKYDHQTNLAWIFGSFIVVLVSMYTIYRIVVPKEQDVFLYENWDRWHKESHH